MPAQVRAFAPPRNVPDLFEALRASLAEELKPANAQNTPSKPKAKKPKPRVEGQREMLLPIPGKKTERTKETAASEEKKPAASAPRRKAG